MDLLSLALQGGRGVVTAPAGARSAIVVGAGGPLGSAVLERALGCGVFAVVHAVVEAPMAPALRGLRLLPHGALGQAGPALADTAFVVFDRARHAHGREDVFHRPAPSALLALAVAVRARGVKHFVVVLPHAPALLPQALRDGLGTLDEQAVASLDFEHIVFVRPSQTAAAAAARGRWLDRVAAGLLAQLHWLVPAREQPLRALQVAAFAVETARLLPTARAGTRVAPAELVWTFAQPTGGVAAIAAWLADRPWRHVAAPRPRL